VRTLLAGFFSILIRGGGYGKPRKNDRRGDASRWRCRQLQLRDGLDQVLVDGHEVRAILLIDYYVGKADKETLLFIDRIGYTIPHGRNEKVSNVDAVHSPDADANLLAFGHVPLLPLHGRSLAFTTFELLTPAQLFVLMLAHLFPAFF
jgi:hypothetical protein